jgi:peptidoglycan/xylan/chitin deacetylase (PgdA/CDA1 family)
MWWAIAAACGIVALVHTLPAPFLLDAMAGKRGAWNMPRTPPPTIYLTYDDGPNPSTTPDLLDALAREGVHATFFLIDEHVTEETAPIIRACLRTAMRWHCIRETVGSLFDRRRTWPAC